MPAFPMTGEKVNIFWFRRDLRLNDNAGLYHALNNDLPVLPFFIFDTEILDKLNNRNDARVTFIRDQLVEINKKLGNHGSSLLVMHGSPVKIWRKLVESYPVNAVFTNRDYEPYAIERDGKVKRLLAKRNISFHTYKDQVIFEKDEIVKADGKPYSIYTPYMKKWRSALSNEDTRKYNCSQLFNKFLESKHKSIPALKTLGFSKTDISIAEPCMDESTLKRYRRFRDFPAKKATSRLGIHLRFGTVSIREVMRRAIDVSDTFINELIWREFFMQVLWHFPEVANRSFKKQYDLIKWRNDENEFERWCKGKTGYPLVDAGMHELNTTGHMHNRVRMVAASFLCKHLLIDWRWGEAYFAEKLLDYELASNNGNWQWVAGSGCDAAPYFRIFNPELQAKKFDPDQEYIKMWIPELNSANYPPPIVELGFARERALKAYKAVIKLD